MPLVIIIPSVVDIWKPIITVKHRTKCYFIYRTWNLTMRPFQSSHCSQCDNREKSNPAILRETPSVNQVWSALLFVFLEITSQGILLQFWSKEILDLILFYCPHISSKQDRRREDSSPKIQGESDESFLLLLLWGSGLAAAANCVELYSSQRWQEQLWLQSPCQLRDYLLWVICQGLSHLCFCATSSNKREALHHSEHRPPAEQRHLSVPSAPLWSLRAQPGLRDNSVIVTSLLSWDKAAFWQEKAVKPWWSGGKAMVIVSQS